MKKEILSAGVGVLVAFPFVASAVNEPVAVIPFSRDGKLIVLQVRINGQAPVPFVVDTGAPHTVFDPKYAQALGLKIETAPDITGVGTGKVSKSITAPATMKLENLQFELPEPWVIDLSGVPMSKMTKGLVGAEIFKHHVVRIDPVAATFTFFDPATFTYEGTGAALPVTFENDRLFLEAELEVPAGKKFTRKLRIDTGSDSSVNDESARQSQETRIQTLGQGLGEPFQSVSGIFTSAKIGPYLFRNFWGPAGPPPLIGMELLRRFIITVDAPRQKIYLEPTAALNEPVPTPPPN